MSSEKIGYDVLLDRRVKQLKEIDFRLEQIIKVTQYKPPGKPPNGQAVMFEIVQIRNDLAQMIRDAEAESDAF